MKRATAGGIFKSVLKYATALVIALVTLLPFYVLVYVAINDPSIPLMEGVFRWPTLTFDNIVAAWQRSVLPGAILNSTIITVSGLLLVVVFGSSAGYLIARYPTKFNQFWFTTFLAGMMVPAIIINVPLYVIMMSIGGINQLWSMILLKAATRLPFSIFLYTAFVQSMTRDIESAAIIDGCTPFSAFWRITFMLMKPATSAVIVTSSLTFWNNYSQAVFFLQNKKSYTIPLAIAQFYTEFGAYWNLVAAAALIGVIPIVSLFLFLQKYFIKGLAAGAVKG
jgi:raffinose/stachyose/melibiose transport system permease protein